MKGRTTLSESTEEMKQMNRLTIFVCLNPSLKPSKIKELDLEFMPPKAKNPKWVQMLAYSLKQNLAFWEVYENFTYNFHRDFNVNLRYENWPNEKDATLNLQSISTYRYDMCTLIQPHDPLASTRGRYVVRISPTLVSQDIPTEMSLAITSENGWQGLIMDDWPLASNQT